MSKKQKPEIQLWLEQHKRLGAQIENKRRRLERWMELRVYLPSGRMTAAKGGGVSDRVAQVAMNIVDLERELESDAELLLATERAIDEVIKAVEAPTLRILLERRYLLHDRFRVIAAALHYDTGRIYQLHPIALQAAAEAKNKIEEK